MTTPIRWDDIQGIVFDAVGTLIEPLPSVADAYAQAARRQGLVVDPGEIKSRFHKYFRDDELDDQLGPLVTDEGLEYRRWRRIVANVLPDLPDLDRGFAELWDHFGHPESWRAFSDVAPALDALESAGVPVRIASNFDGRLRGVAAGQPALRDRADPIVISSEVGFRKPHPAFYRAACESLELDPENVLYVGDDPENDVLGPRRAGLWGVLVDRDGRRPDDLPHLANLHELIDRVLGQRGSVSAGLLDGNGPGGR